MPVYRYKALSQEGRVVKGLVDAASLDSVAELLNERKLIVVKLSENQRKSFSLPSFVPLIGKVRRKSVVIFSRQLSTMIAATVPIVQSLKILAGQTDDKALREVVNDMANDVDGGMKLSSAFAKHPDVFNNFFIAMLKSGETSGRLDKVLSYLATQREKDYELVSKIKGAMIYPAFIIVALIGVGAVMLIFVIPKMTILLKETGGEMPFMTRMLIGVSDFLVGYWWVLIIAVVGGVLGVNAFLRTEYFRERWDYGKLKIPIFGDMFMKIIMSRFSTSLATLIKGGVPISRALTITGDVVSNVAVKALIDQTVKEVEDGNSITSIFSQSKLVPTMVPQMLSVGERTGRMDEVLDRIGEFYAREVDVMIGSLTSLIEPLIMIILGAGVGVMVAAVILPMFQVANSIS